MAYDTVVPGTTDYDVIPVPDIRYRVPGATIKTSEMDGIRVSGTRIQVPGTRIIPIPGTRYRVPYTETRHLIPVLVPGTESLVPGTESLIIQIKGLLLVTLYRVPGTTNSLRFEAVCIRPPSRVIASLRRMNDPRRLKASDHR